MNSGGVDITFFLMMGAIFAIFYLLVIRPQQKQQREREAFLQTAAKGDEVVISRLGAPVQGMRLRTADDEIPSGPSGPLGPPSGEHGPDSERTRHP